MRIRYILVYGSRFQKIKFFEKFKRMADYILMKNITDFHVFERMKEDTDLEKFLFGDKI